MACRFISLVMAAMMVFSAVAQSRTFPSTQQHFDQLARLIGTAPGSCNRGGAMVYDIDADYFYDADLQWCDPVMADMTRGSLGPTKRQVIILSNGYLHMGSYYSITRATPNKSYRLRGRPNELMGKSANGEPTLTWAAVRHILPFAPQEYLDFQLTGGRGVAYANLKPVGDPALMYPLNEYSVVVGMGGYLFENPNALMAVLTYAETTAYMEVVYFQSDADDPRFLRAYLPIRTQAQAGAKWSGLRPDWTRPIAEQPDRFGASYYIKLAFGALAVIGAVLVVNSIEGEHTYKDPYAGSQRSPNTEKENPDDSGPSAMDPGTWPE